MPAPDSARKIRLLFVCAHNKDRSVTAASLFQDSDQYEARARGVSAKAVVQVTADDLDWADRILVMESKHARRLHREYARLLRNREIEVLDIPDDYNCMDPELVEILATALRPRVPFD